MNIAGAKVKKIMRPCRGNFKSRSANGICLKLIFSLNLFFCRLPFLPYYTNLIFFATKEVSGV